MRANSSNRGAALGSIMPNIMTHHMRKMTTAYPTVHVPVAIRLSAAVPPVDISCMLGWVESLTPTDWVIWVISKALMPIPAPASM